MKSILAIAALFFLACVPARAQGYLGTNASSYSGSSVNNQHNGMEKAYFPQHTTLPGPSSRMEITSGSNDEFIPSLFMCYDKALAKGITDLAAKPKTLVEVARENRKVQRSKASTSFVQDANGKLVKEVKEEE